MLTVALLLLIQLLDLAIACGLIFRTLVPSVLAAVAVWWLTHIAPLPPGRVEILVVGGAAAVLASWAVRARRRRATDDGSLALMLADLAALCRSPRAGRSVAIAVLAALFVFVALL